MSTNIRIDPSLMALVHDADVRSAERFEASGLPIDLGYSGGMAGVAKLLEEVEAGRIGPDVAMHIAAGKAENCDPGNQRKEGVARAFGDFIALVELVATTGR